MLTMSKTIFVAHLRKHKIPAEFLADRFKNSRHATDFYENLHCCKLFPSKKETNGVISINLHESTNYQPQGYNFADFCVI